MNIVEILANKFRKQNFNVHTLSETFQYEGLVAGATIKRGNAECVIFLDEDGKLTVDVNGFQRTWTNTDNHPAIIGAVNYLLWRAV